MSAIFGIYYRQGKRSSLSLLNDMRQKLIHRERNGTVMIEHKSIGLGQLNGITQYSHSRLYPKNYRDYIKIVLDGRIDNRAELLSMLNLRQYNNAKIGDEEIIIHAYLKWNKKCVNYIKGIFVFAIWDDRLQSLTIANDHIGLRNIYYYMNHDIFAFASEISALRAINKINWQHNNERVASFVLGTHFNKSHNQTFYKNIHRLKRSTILEIDKSNLQLFDYWDLAVNSTTIKYSNENEYIEDFKEKFILSIQNRMKHQPKVGIALSGGLDSSSIVSVADKLQTKSQSIHTYHVESNYTDSDEKLYKDAVVNSCNTTHNDIASLQTFQSLYECRHWLDQPFQPLHLGVMNAVWKRMHKEDINVFLSGEDGDGIVNDGYYYPIEVLHQEGFKKYKQTTIQRYRNKYFQSSQNRFTSQKAYFNSLNELNLFRYYKYSLKNKAYRKIISTGLTSIILAPKSSIKPILKLLHNRYIEPNRIINKNQYHNIFLNELTPSVLANIKKENSENYFHNVKSEHIHSTKTTPTYYYEDVRNISVRLNIDIRYPFLDKDVIEICTAAPGKIKWHNGIGRGILREGMQNILPEKIRVRKSKSDFTEHIIENFRNNEIDFYRETYLNTNKNKFFNETYLEQILTEFENKNNTYNQLLGKFKILKKHAYLSNWLNKDENL